MNLHQLAEGARMVRRRWLYQTNRYVGSPLDIARACVESCWNKKHSYFQVSAGHFNQFYMRDFGLCVGALMQLGHKNEVKQTLEYALSAFSRHNRVTTQITPAGTPIDSFGEASDSLPFLLHSLDVADLAELREVYQPFLEMQADRYRETFLDQQGLVRSGYVGSIKDQAIRNSSCYDNTMAAWLSKLLVQAKFRNPLRKWDLNSQLHKRFWTGTHFKDDIQSRTISGDANVFPAWCGLASDSQSAACIEALRREKLDQPFPLKYTLAQPAHKFLFWPNLFSKNYEGNTVWMHLGLAYLDVVAAQSPSLLPSYLNAYESLIAQHGNFLEVYHPNGSPYASAWYRCDEGMLWASKWLALKLTLNTPQEIITEIS